MTGVMKVEDLFNFQDGSFVLTGVVESHDGKADRTTWEVFVGGQSRGRIAVESEIMPKPRTTPARAFVTRDDPGLTKDEIGEGTVELRFVEQP